MKKRGIYLFFICFFSILLLIILYNKKRVHSLFTLELTIGDTLIEGDPVSCATKIYYHGTEENIEFQPTKGIRTIFVHESGMEIVADYQYINNQNIIFDKEYPLVFDCSNYGWYKRQSSMDVSRVVKMDYDIQLSSTPLFLIAGKYTVYTEIQGVLLDNQTEICFASPKKSIKVEEVDKDLSNVGTFQNEDIKGKVFINKNKYTKDDSFYCFVSYQYIPQEREHLLYAPMLSIRNETRTIFSDNVVQMWTYGTVLPGIIIIETPCSMRFGNKNNFYVDHDKEVGYSKISLKSGEYKLITRFGLAEDARSVLKIEIPFTVE